jgi:membrane carboxypeptidase/penicillin-binding protein
MKKLIKFTGLFLTAMIIAISAYYIFVVVNAKAYTHATILKDLKKSQWRSPEGAARKFEIRCQDLSKRQKEILIKVQDPGFYNHSGIDLSTPGNGLTTITQAIVKKLYFENFKSGIAKIKQSFIAKFVVHELISKEDQLTYFINTMYFGKVDGQPIVGLASAANAYYQQPVNLLTEEQYISLIAMIVMPGTFHIIDHPEWNKDRTNRIKALMAGEYTPKGLMDQFYGELPQEVIKAGLPKASYFDSLYKDK